jgi:hypothetical protein
MNRIHNQQKMQDRNLAVLAKKKGLTLPLLHGSIKLFCIKKAKKPFLGSLSAIKAFVLE